jgi:hypothetical protein
MIGHVPGFMRGDDGRQIEFGQHDETPLSLIRVVRLVVDLIGETII